MRQSKKKTSTSQTRFRVCRPRVEKARCSPSNHPRGRPPQPMPATPAWNTGRVQPSSGSRWNRLRRRWSRLPGPPRIWLIIVAVVLVIGGLSGLGSGSGGGSAGSGSGQGDSGGSNFQASVSGLPKVQAAGGIYEMQIEVTNVRISDQSFLHRLHGRQRCLGD